MLFDWNFVVDQAPALIRAFGRTLQVGIVAILASTAIGVIGAAILALRIPGLQRATDWYVDLFRNTPLLVQIFFLYFALPELGIKLSGFAVAWLSLALWGGAYAIENFRAGFEAVRGGYKEAALALGLTPTQAFFTIELPIGLRIALPSTSNTLIAVLKSTSFMVAIGFEELTDVSVGIVAQTLRVFEMFFVLGVVYLCLVALFSAGMQLVERRLRFP